MVVIKRTAFIAAVMVMLLLANGTQARVSMVVNGSFESDGRSIDYITPGDAPYRWCDVNLPANKFGASLWSDWSTHGSYYLTIYSTDWMSFDVNDMATVSQQVYFEDVNQIIFDLKLDTTWGYPWDPAIRSAVLLIDTDVVWESNSVGSDVRGEYLDQIYTVDANYKDANSHKLSLGIRANSGGFPDDEYHTQWDFVKFDTHCGGFGYLPADISRDCYVDMLDLEILAEQWLVENPNYEYDLVEDGIVNFLDFAVFADSLGLNSNWENLGNDDFLEPELEFIDSDINDDGIVDYGDIFVLAENWLSQGNCIRADLSNDGIVNFRDFAILTNEWLLKSWLYGIGD